MAGNSRRGVLRHKQQIDAEEKDKFENLFVFGYACKLFRDDEKALDIDQGNLLIPWMGDDSIKIDRYDARGTLFDLKPHETPQGGYDRTEGLTAEEMRVERLCDEERYFALYKDEAEEAVIKEEEIKRLNQDLNEVTSEEVSYHQVPFSYSTSESCNSKAIANEAPLQSTLGQLGDAVYVPPPMLDVPPDIIVPPTQKLARIVEKTANFISSQGTQMEIVVKAKQANNPMFQFLHFDNALHPFYRHVLTAIRNGTYDVPAEEPGTETNDKEEPDNNGQSNQSDSESENYLHPSLQPKIVTEPSHLLSESENQNPSQSSNPPSDTCSFIDKTASYFSRNGRHLESAVQSKGDQRFVFLHPDHPFHGYYVQKLTLYTEMYREQESKKYVQVEEPKASESPINTEMTVTDPELMKTERRKKATLFLDQMKRDKTSSKSTLEDDLVEESESPISTTKLSKSASPDDIEIIGAIQTRDRTYSRSPSRSPTHSRPERKRRQIRRPSRSISRSPSKSRSRSRTRNRSGSRTRRRSRSRSPSRSRIRRVRRSPSPDRRRRQHKKHRSRDRHRKDKKKRRSRDRLKKKRRHRSRSRSVSDSLSLSRSRSRSRGTKSRSPSLSRVSPITSAVRKLAAEASKSASGTSSPLPQQLVTAQPAFAKIAEGIRAKVIAMIEGDKK